MVGGQVVLQHLGDGEDQADQGGEEKIVKAVVTVCWYWEWRLGEAHLRRRNPWELLHWHPVSPAQTCSDK